MTADAPGSLPEDGHRPGHGQRSIFLPTRVECECGDVFEGTDAQAQAEAHREAVDKAGA